VQNGGPALATAIACYFDFFALILIFRLRYGPMGIREIAKSFSKILLCSAIMGAACWLGAHYTEFTIHSRFLVQLFVFFALISGATALYLALAWIFRCSEIEEIYGIASRKKRGGEAYVES
jgi:peptidoglycan biosynthesis protein MviN/MurJ (putative lipid II flippase)